MRKLMISNNKISSPNLWKKELVTVGYGGNASNLSFEGEYIVFKFLNSTTKRITLNNNLVGYLTVGKTYRINVTLVLNLSTAVVTPTLSQPFNLSYNGVKIIDSNYNTLIGSFKYTTTCTYNTINDIIINISDAYGYTINSNSTIKLLLEIIEV